MTHLREEMDDAYVSMHVDLERLVTQAQLKGGRVRRRNRQLAAAASSLLVLAAVGLGTWAATGPLGAGGEAHDVVPAAVVASSPRPLTGMEALEAALAAVVPGGAVSHGTGPNVYDDGDPYAKSALRFAAPGAAGAGWISLTTFAAPEDTSALTDCGLVEAHYPNCEVTPLPDGSVLLTHDVPVWNGPSQSKRLGTSVAGLLVSHGMVVSLAASIPFADERETQPLSPDAPLTTEQLVAVLSQPEWGQLAPLG